jgi:hypothetical protein
MSLHSYGVLTAVIRGQHLISHDGNHRLTMLVAICGRPYISTLLSSTLSKKENLLRVDEQRISHSKNNITVK